MAAPYAPKERVLCYHGPLIYEAKVLDVKQYTEPDESPVGQAGWAFYVHYKGWKQK
jgi:mortality factor 4-like protein 1